MDSAVKGDEEKNIFCCVQLFATMDCSLQRSSVHGILQARILLQWIFLTQGLNACLMSPGL